jgi:hypothetical protein
MWYTDHVARHHHIRSIALALSVLAGSASPTFAQDPAMSSPSKIAGPRESAAPRTPVLQVAGPPFPLDPPLHVPPLPREPPAPEQRQSDGAGPRLTFGRSFTPGLTPGFYGRFETEYFVVTNRSIVGMLLGLEGWGTEGATSGGGAIPITMFVGARGGPFEGPKAPMLLFTLGLGVDLVVYDRIGGRGGFGLFSPLGVVTTGVEVTPGLRLLADGRAVYRWHWTSPSQAQYQLGLTVGLNSNLWDGP